MRGRVIVGLCLLLSCKRAERGAKEPEVPLSAELSGCAAVIHSGCVLGEDRAVRLFVPGSGHVEVPGVEITKQRVTPEGVLFSMRVPEGMSTATALRIETSGVRAKVLLHFAPSPRPSWFAEAQKRRQEGKLDEVSLQAKEALASPDVATRAAAHGLLARVAMRRGAFEEAVSSFRAAIADDEAAGLVSDRVDDAYALAFLLYSRLRRYGEARAVIDAAAAARGDYPDYADGRARHDLYSAQLAWATGDTRTANRELASARSRAERLGLDGVSRAAEQVLGMVACSAGSSRSCLATLREAETRIEHATDVPACERAELAISRGFAELEVAETDPASDVGALGSADRRALSFLEACPDQTMRSVAMEHLAMASVLAKKPAEAKKLLAESRSLAPEPRTIDAAIWLDIEGRIAELEGARTAALAAFDASRALARGAALRTNEWQALLGRARVLEATKRDDDALEAYREAEAILDEVVRMVPFGEGRASAAADGARSVRRATRLLLDHGRAGEALDMLRHAHARLAASFVASSRVAALSGPERERWERAVSEFRRARAAVDADAGDDWKKSSATLEGALSARAAKLAALRARLDDVSFVIAPVAAVPDLPAEDTVLAFAYVGEPPVLHGFVGVDGKVSAYRIGELPPDTSAMATALLGPAQAELSRAKRIRVMTDDALAGIDVHALPLTGAPLVKLAPVVYATDLGALHGTSPTPANGALMVADPTGDLPAARSEGQAVLSALRSTYDVRLLVGREATAAEVRQALTAATLFHYAGHGLFRGREGAESALPLAQGGLLTLGDVFTLPRVPSSVVLSGCEAGRQQGDGSEGAASMAQAFLVAGASVVIAPVRVVDDRAASDLAVRLHTPPGVDLASALRHVQLDAFEAGKSGWESFRAFVR